MYNVHNVLINFVITFGEQWYLSTRACLLLWILHIRVSFKEQNDLSHHYLLENLNQGSSHQDQASKNLKLQQRFALSTFAWGWGAVRGLLHVDMGMAQSSPANKTCERKVTTWQTMEVNKIVFHFFGIKHCTEWTIMNSYALYNLKNDII